MVNGAVIRMKNLEREPQVPLKGGVEKDLV